MSFAPCVVALAPVAEGMSFFDSPPFSLALSVELVAGAADAPTSSGAWSSAAPEPAGADGAPAAAGAADAPAADGAAAATLWRSLVPVSDLARLRVLLSASCKTFSNGSLETSYFTAATHCLDSSFATSLQSEMSRS